MNGLLKGFNEFNKIFEQVEQESGINVHLLADSDSEKKSANEFMEALGEKDTTKLTAALDNAITKGYSVISKMKSAWDQRAKLDAGPLKKVRNWYVGKGAWRLNSNKADYLGLTPEWMQWFDPKQDEIISKFFPELEKGESSISPSGELIGFKSDEEPEETPNLPVKKDEFEKELVLGENAKYIKRLVEDEEFHLGPEPSIEGEAVVITPNELIDELVANYKMEHRANVMIWGAPGIGKTDIVNQAAKKIATEVGAEICVLVVTLAQMQPYDLNGIPLLFAEKGTEQTITDLELRGQIKMDFAVPAWLPGKGDMDQGILFFDEINRAAPDMLAAALSLLLDRKAQKYVMPDGWRVWAASNRSLDTTAISSFEAAVASRFLGGHLHLVPTVESWIEWARSDKGLYKGISAKEGTQFYVPDEFLSFLRHYEIGAEGKSKDLEGGSKFYDLKGKPIKTKFKYFYDYDKAKLMATPTGVQVGFPNPRNWATGFKNVYARVLSKYEADAPKGVDERKKAISMFATALEKREDRSLIDRTLASVVGKNAADVFIQYTLMLARHNDAEGTLSEKVYNVLHNPKGPRPLLNIPRITNPSEIFAIFSLVLGEIESLGDKYNEDNLLNWAQWAVDLVKNQKVKEGEITSHVSSVLSHNPNVFAKAAKKASSDTAAAKVMKDFTEVFREIIQKFKNL